MTATDRVELDGNVVAERPTPGVPRPYEFPDLARGQLANGLTILVADLPGRPLVSAAVGGPGRCRGRACGRRRRRRPGRPRPDRGNGAIRRDRA